MAEMMCRVSGNSLQFSVDTTSAIVNHFGEFDKVMATIYGDEMLFIPTKNEGSTFKVSMCGRDRNRLQIPIGSAKRFVELVPGRRYIPKIWCDCISVKMERFV